MKLETGNKSAGNGSKKNKKILKKEKAEKLENNRKGQSLQKLVTKHPHFSFLTNGKIKCQITNH